MNNMQLLIKALIKSINQRFKTMEDTTTVNELIEMLKQFDGHLPVMIMDYNDIPEDCARSIDSENMDQQMGQDGDGNPVDMVMIHINQV